MKLCKACKKKLDWDSPWYQFCKSEKCRKQRKHKMYCAWRKKHPYIPKVRKPIDTQATNWVCDCGYFIPNFFTSCKDCKCQRKHVADNSINKGIFVPEKHGVDIDSYIKAYFDKVNNLYCK